MEIPTAFTNWIQLDALGSLEDLDTHGIYLLGRFERRAPTEIDLNDQRIIYIGETCSQTLAKRLGQFRRALLTGRPGHSGGLTLSAHLINGSINPKHIFVSIMSVPHPAPEGPAIIRYIERALILKFVQTHGTLPVGNSK